MKYAVKMGLGVMMYIPSFIKTRSEILISVEGGIHRHTESMEIS
jgi:hypothetical protein